jgi:parvulin-like peptidyl-prolyl isomerase
MSKPVGYLNSEPIRLESLQTQLLEAAGGQVLFEYVLDKQLAEELKRKGITISEEDVKKEERLMLNGLDTDINQAQRILNELKERRGLGPVRFHQMLYRNAGLRVLVKVPATYDPLAMRNEYEVIYGPRYEVRIAILESMAKAQEFNRRMRSGESFTDLVIQMSSDSSRLQGGLLSPFSIQDESYPKAIRDQLPLLKVGQVSDPIALDASATVALIRLERKIEGSNVSMDSVKRELEQSLTLRMQRIGMDEQARTLMIKAKVTWTSTEYQRVWDLQAKRFGKPER